MRGLRESVSGVEQLRQGVQVLLEKMGTPQLRADSQRLGKGGEEERRGEVPFSTHEHVPAVDGHEVHLQDRDADEAREGLIAIRTDPDQISLREENSQEERRRKLEKYPPIIQLRKRKQHSVNPILSSLNIPPALFHLKTQTLLPRQPHRIFPQPLRIAPLRLNIHHRASNDPKIPLPIQPFPVPRI